jgi:hypothetical protein
MTPTPAPDESPECLPSWFNAPKGLRALNDLVFGDIRPKALDVKFDGRLDIRNGRFIGVTFSYNHTMDAERVGHIAVRVLLDNDFDLPHGEDLLV